MRALQITREDFNNLENHSPKTSKQVATYIDDETKSAETKVLEFLEGQKKEYKGWDGVWYPRFQVNELKLQ